MQKASNDTDPGDGGLGDPILVGDGQILLIVMGCIYTIIKFSKIRKSSYLSACFSKRDNIIN